MKKMIFYLISPVIITLSVVGVWEISTIIKEEFLHRQYCSEFIDGIKNEEIYFVTSEERTLTEAKIDMVIRYMQECGK